MRAERTLRARTAFTITQYRYDADGNRRITIAPTGMTEQRYDGLNRLVDTILPN